MNSLLILIHCCFLIVCVYAEAEWERRQREHSVSRLTAAQHLKLCSMGDTNALFTDLNNIGIQRVVGSPGHKQVANYINKRLREYFFTSESDTFSERTPYGQKKFRNLIGTFDLQAPRRLVLACHYDSKFMPEFIGATDSAAPCALLLDVARSLNAYMHTSPHKVTPVWSFDQDLTLQLVFFDGEEAFRHWTDTDSLYGSRHLAEKWNNTSYVSLAPGGHFSVKNELDRIDVLTLLDLLGYRNPNIYNYNGLGAERYFTDLASTGVPALHLIPVPFPPVWHNTGDNLDAIDHDTMVKLASVLRTFVAAYLGLSV